MRGAVPEHAQGKPLEIWWQDEARVGQQGTLSYVWADKGIAYATTITVAA